MNRSAWSRAPLAASCLRHRARVGGQNFLTDDFVDGARAETTGAYTREWIDQAMIQKCAQLLEGLRKQAAERHGLCDPQCFRGFYGEELNML